MYALITGPGSRQRRLSRQRRRHARRRERDRRLCRSPRQRDIDQRRRPESGLRLCDARLRRAHRHPSAAESGERPNAALPGYAGKRYSRNVFPVSGFAASRPSGDGLFERRRTGRRLRRGTGRRGGRELRRRQRIRLRQVHRLAVSGRTDPLSGWFPCRQGPRVVRPGRGRARRTAQRSRFHRAVHHGAGRRFGQFFPYSAPDPGRRRIPLPGAAHQSGGKRQSVYCRCARGRNRRGPVRHSCRCVRLGFGHRPGTRRPGRSGLAAQHRRTGACLRLCGCRVRRACRCAQPADRGSERQSGRNGRNFRGANRRRHGVSRSAWRGPGGAGDEQRRRVGSVLRGRVVGERRYRFLDGIVSYRGKVYIGAIPGRFVRGSGRFSRRHGEVELLQRRLRRRAAGERPGLCRDAADDRARSGERGKRANDPGRQAPRFGLPATGQDTGRHDSSGRTIRASSLGCAERGNRESRRAAARHGTDPSESRSRSLGPRERIREQQPGHGSFPDP